MQEWRIARATLYPGRTTRARTRRLALPLTLTLTLTLTITLTLTLTLPQPRTYHSCTHSTSDVKELVPELFYLPDVLVNHNQLPLGVRQVDRE